MFELAMLQRDSSLKLPDILAQRFHPLDRFIVWIDGDTLYLKRIEPSPLQMVEQAPDDEPLTLDEIDEIVHEDLEMAPPPAASLGKSLSETRVERVALLLDRLQGHGRGEDLTARLLHARREDRELERKNSAPSLSA